MSFLWRRQYDRRVSVIAIPLLTLVPGRLGGSETYVRELLRGLGRTGTNSYRPVLPPVAPEAGEGLPAVIAREYRRASSTPGRLAAMGLASARPDRLAEHLRGADVVHFPLTIELPRTPVPKVVTLHDVQHLDLPELFPRAERALRVALWHRSLRRAGRVVAISEFVRERAVAKLGLDPARVRVVPLGLDHDLLRPGAASASRSCSIPRGRGGTRIMSGSMRRSRSCGVNGRSCSWC